jgi:small subunit ribosomal protein S17
MVKNIGIEAKPPEKSCDSASCPWHGSLRVRGRVFAGKVLSSRPSHTAIVSWDFY